jgi:LysM repeat protein
LRWLSSPVVVAVGAAGVAGLAAAATLTPGEDAVVDEPVPVPAPVVEAEPEPDPVPVATPQEVPEPVGENEPEAMLPPQDAPKVRPKWIRHRVVPRESLTRIALRYGVKVSSIKEWNKLGDEAVLKPRQKLKVFARKFPPKRELIDHVAAVGDTWGSIARAYGVAPSDIRSYNVRRTGRRLDVGEKVYIWIDPIIYDEIQGHAADPGPSAEVYPGGFSVGTPNEGQLVNPAKIPESDDYDLRFVKSVYGTSLAVRATVHAMNDFRSRTDYPGVIWLGTMSRERGGDLGQHKSHQTGRDLDVRLPLREGVPSGLKPIGRRIDWLATWHLINAFLDTGEVQVIFFDYGRQRRVYKAAQEIGISEEELDRVLQYPIGKMASRGRVRHSHGHDAHIHVRFRCAQWETECAD